MNRIKFLVAMLLMLGAIPLAQAQPSISASAALIARGEYLARAGDCVSCHTAPGGKAFAGGLKMGTPLGAIYSTNITPDPQTGIGNYTFEDFARAVRDGIAKDGHHLYAAMPYPSYAKITDSDLHALYAFFMKAVPPVKQANKPNEIKGIESARWPLAVWNWAFVDKGVFVPDPKHDAVWNRGAYLVEGLGHCGACHTPRGWLYEEKALDGSNSLYLQGAELDAWYAPDLRGDVRTGLGSWSQADLVAFLKTGHSEKGVAFGSMLDVINNSTPYLTDADIHAIAVYLKSLPATGQQSAYTYSKATTKSLEGGKPQEPGKTVYLGYCSSCHALDGKGRSPYIPPLAGNPVVLNSDPVSLINLVLNGADPIVVRGAPAAYRMPQFRVQLTNQQIASVLSFVRQGWGNDTPGVKPNQVAKLRPLTDPSSDRVIILKMR